MMNAHSILLRWSAVALYGLLPLICPALAQETSVRHAPDLVTLPPSATLPYSRYASAEAKARFIQIRSEQDHPDPSDVADQRRFYQRFNDERLAEIQRRYHANVEATSIAGVPVHIVDPKHGVKEHNHQRILINLHGGAFIWGSGSGALVEAIPIAVVAGMRVITVDYRLAPEHPYPAAVDDVEQVYRELLQQYRAENIGIYGCSAGGMLTAQVTARIVLKGLPAPGAAGHFCGTGLLLDGDWASLGQLAMGAEPIRPDDRALSPYLRTAHRDDPVAYPGDAPELLARFPPTLFMAGGRDFAVSALTVMQRRLLAAGVDAELVLFDGLWHAFSIYAELPESQEAYTLIAQFFDRRLGK